MYDTSAIQLLRGTMKIALRKCPGGLKMKERERYCEGCSDVVCREFVSGIQNTIKKIKEAVK